MPPGISSSGQLLTTLLANAKPPKLWESIRELLPDGSPPTRFRLPTSHNYRGHPLDQEWLLQPPPGVKGASHRLRRRPAAALDPCQRLQELASIKGMPPRWSPT